MPPRAARPFWTAGCTCRSAGPAMPGAAPRPRYPAVSPSRPSRSWRAPCWTRRSTMASGPVSGLRQDDWASWLLIRRSVGETPEVAFYLVAGPAATTLAAAVRVAGMRWTIEQCLEEGKGETGLDEYEVRHWPSWHRHI